MKVSPKYSTIGHSARSILVVLFIFGFININHNISQVSSYDSKEIMFKTQSVREEVLACEWIPVNEAFDYNTDGVVDLQDVYYLRWYISHVRRDDPAMCEGRFYSWDAGVQMCCQEWQICDLQCDQKISAFDMQVLARRIQQWYPEEVCGQAICEEAECTDATYFDVNNDGFLNLQDVLTLQLNIITNGELCDSQFNCDMNCDGAVTLTDLTVLIAMAQWTLDLNTLACRNICPGTVLDFDL